MTTLPASRAKLLLPPHPINKNLDDGSKYVSLGRVTLFDVHEPQTKRDRSSGTVVRVGATELELEQMSANSNQLCAEGRPRSIHLGHNPPNAWEKPDHTLPVHVGWAHRFAVTKDRGKTVLQAELKIHRSQYNEASTYPWVSIELCGYDKPGGKYVDSIALIRKKPDRSELPAVNFASPSPPILDRESLPMTPRMSFSEFVTRHRLVNSVDARRRYDEEARAGTLDSGSLNYGASRPAPPPSDVMAFSKAVVEFGVKRKITSVSEARRLFLQENPQFAAELNFSAAPSTIVNPATRLPEPPQVETWAIPNGGTALETVFRSPGFVAAVRNYAARHRIFDATKAGNMLCDEIRERLVGYRADGVLLFPIQAAEYDYGGEKRARLSPSDAYDKKRGEYWSKVASDKAKSLAAERERAKVQATLEARARQPLPQNPIDYRRRY